MYICECFYARKIIIITSYIITSYIITIIIVLKWKLLSWAIATTHINKPISVIIYCSLSKYSNYFIQGFAYPGI